MKLRIALGTIIFIAIVALMPQWAFSQEAQPNSELRLTYVQLLEDVISRCDAKHVFLDTRSANIRKAVALSVMKAAFIETYKEALVQEMLDTQVRPSPVTVQYFVNNRFYRLIR